MTDRLEPRLRSALGTAATRAPQAPARFSAEVVLRSRRRRTRRHALVAGVCVVAVAVPVAVTVTRDTGGGGIAAVVTATPTAFEDPLRNPDPVGKRLTIDNPSEGRPLSLWYARARNGATVFCRKYTSRTGGGTEFCGEGPVIDGAEATDQGSTESFPPPVTGKVLHYGTAQAGIARVVAVREGGGRATGTLRTPQGAPQAIWTVTVSADEPVTAFEFLDGLGRTVKRIERQPPVFPETDAKPVGSTVEMPGGLVVGLYETPDRSLIWKLGGRAVAMNTLSPGGPLTDMGGRPMKAELREHEDRWFGITGAGTARVALVLRDGTTVTADTRPEPWQAGDFRMFAGTQRRTDDIYAEGFELVGYDRDGAELWREDHGPTR
ncbi:hypothetical protein [Streptosporangium jomthongense]|uniref:Uncharacterized protein n=1 Tax=Streptosporangium jomthongense TaxID=1193683 RepID=A0ABV8FF22_9ACTN